MAQLINATTHADSRGKLTVIEKVIPFDIKRIFYIYDVIGDRGNHRNKLSKMALVCVKGACRVKVIDNNSESIYNLDSPEKILILQPEEYRTMYDFSQDAVLLVLASEHYSADDYINEHIQ